MKSECQKVNSKCLPHCSGCSNWRQTLFRLYTIKQGYMHDYKGDKQNTIVFLISGEMRIEREGHPPVIIQPGSLYLFLEKTVSNIYYTKVCKMVVFDLHALPYPCTHIVQAWKELPAQMDRVSSLPILPLLEGFLEGLAVILQSGFYCAEYSEAKRTELFFLLTHLYSSETLAAFFHPVLLQTNLFKSFVEENYQKIKTVEEFAALSEYSLSKFRKKFLAEYKEPVYQWLIKKRKADILRDLLTTDLSISEIARKNDFESLSQFSNYCKRYLGSSPRGLRKTGKS